MDMKLVFSAPFLESIADLPIDEQQSLIDEIQSSFDSGTMFDNMTPVDPEDMPPELLEILNAELDLINKALENGEEITGTLGISPKQLN